MAITDERGVTYTASTEILQAYLDGRFDRTQYLRLLTRFYEMAVSYTHLTLPTIYSV